ncbi:MAG: TIR domain-containing protein [Lacunisphaera sp.]|nr:TIR domain-containing protein [Lacunisphaera sp.]
MSDAPKAVFLSYARDDAAAARRIAEALRASGLEVWFDENELRGGDTWDAKIRQQIDACALFIPVISSHTQERGKGYFRLEWKLAVEQTHLMAEGMAFLAPVVVDDTREAGAVVPPEFMKVQWTRLPGALPTPQFVEQVKRLLEPAAAKSSPPAGWSPASGRAEQNPTATNPPGGRVPPESRKSARGRTWGAMTAVVIGVAVALGVFRKAEPAPAPAPVVPPTAPAPAASREPSVAVLAFANLSDDKGNEYFSDGISEELLNVLAKVPGLKVSARTSAFYFKGKNVPVPDIARQLGVAYVVEGSVQRSGDRVKITAQLIKAVDGFHLWSETYTRDMKDIFALQDEIAGRIAASLSDKLGVTVPTLAKTTPEAYTLYLQARATLAKRGVENLRESVKQFEAVVALDPDYLPARSGLARSLSLIPAWSRTISLGANQEGLDRATAGARLVIEREPDNAEAWSALGYIVGLYDWRWREAGEAVARSLALAPNDAEIVNFAGDYYRYILDPQKMLETEKRAVELNPLQAVNHLDVAFAYLALGQYELALAPARTCISLAPELQDSYEALVRAYGNLRRFAEMRAAITAVRQVKDADPAVIQNMEILAAILEGRTSDALQLQEAFRPHVEQGGYSPTEYGYHFLLLGQPEKAVYWLKLGVQGHDAIMVDPAVVDLGVIAADPVTRSVLDDPGLKELLEARANAQPRPKK